MRTNLDLLALDARSGRLSTADRSKIIDEVQAQTIELSTLTSDLIILTRDETSTVRDPVDLREVVQTAVEGTRRRSPGLTFVVELSPLTLLGDARSLARAVGNLLDNAAQWSPPGGTVHIRLVGHQLSVADEGPGIADADLPHVFDRFYRGESARSTAGTGLGLSMSAKAVADQGGTIQASRSHHGGAQLTIELPTTRDLPDPAPVLPADGPRAARAPHHWPGAGAMIEGLSPVRPV